MQASTDYKKNEAFGLLLQGPPKTGKTTAALLFPKPYIADCDNNISGAKRWLEKNHPSKTFLYDTICFLPDGTLVPPEQRWTRLANCCNEAVKSPDVQTVIIDSAATICDFLIDHIVAGKHGTGRAEGMTISDWIPFRTMLSRLVTQLRNTRKLFIMTSHEENVKDETSGRIIVRTNIPSKLADNFGGFFSDVWRTEIDEFNGQPVYVIRAVPTKSIPAIGNSLGLPATFTMSQDNLTKLLSAISA